MGDMLRRACHMDDLSWIPQPDTTTSEQATSLPEDVEDKLRKALYDLFDLQPLEILVLQGIMQQKTLQQIATDLTKLFATNSKVQSRHHVFQLRKSMLKKLPYIADALLTVGQRKTLKED